MKSSMPPSCKGFFLSLLSTSYFISNFFPFSSGSQIEAPTPTLKFRTFSQIGSLNNNKRTNNNHSNNNKSNVNQGGEDEEDLRTQLEFMKKEYFQSLVISLKMQVSPLLTSFYFFLFFNQTKQRLAEGDSTNINSLDLYEKAQKQCIDPSRFGEWIRAQFSQLSKE